VSENLVKIISILTEYTEAESKAISAEDELQSLGIDSLSLVEIIFDLEEAFDVKVPDEADLEAMNLPLTTVANIESLITKLQETLDE